MEDNDKADKINKDNNDDKGISALALDRDLVFSRGHQTKPNHTIPYPTIPNQTIPNQTKGISALGLI